MDDVIIGISYNGSFILFVMILIDIERVTGFDFFVDAPITAPVAPPTIPPTTAALVPPDIIVAPSCTIYQEEATTRVVAPSCWSICRAGMSISKHKLFVCILK